MLTAFWLRLRHALRIHKMPLLVLVAGLVLPWVVFVNVAEDLWESGGFIGDKQILAFLHAHASPGQDRLALALTAAGGPLPLGALAGLLTAGLAVWGSRAQAWFFGLSVGGAMGLNLLVKVLFARPRPTLWLSLEPAWSPLFNQKPATRNQKSATRNNLKPKLPELPA